jgi:hypothetical protein
MVGVGPHLSDRPHSQSQSFSCASRNWGEVRGCRDVFEIASRIAGEKTHEVQVVTKARDRGRCSWRAYIAVNGHHFSPDVDCGLPRAINLAPLDYLATKLLNASAGLLTGCAFWLFPYCTARIILSLCPRLLLAILSKLEGGGGGQISRRIRVRTGGPGSDAKISIFLKGKPTRWLASPFGR